MALKGILWIPGEPAQNNIGMKSPKVLNHGRHRHFVAHIAQSTRAPQANPVDSPSRRH